MPKHSPDLSQFQPLSTWSDLLIPPHLLPLGSFAFVIYDSVFHRVLAARDAEGTQPMYWGATSGCWFGVLV